MLPITYATAQILFENMKGDAVNADFQGFKVKLYICTIPAFTFRKVKCYISLWTWLDKQSETSCYRSC